MRARLPNGTETQFRCEKILLRVVRKPSDFLGSDNTATAQNPLVNKSFTATLQGSHYSMVDLAINCTVTGILKWRSSVQQRSSLYCIILLLNCLFQL